MRITCPNCGAQYEVAADAIPAQGRDLQCSACGHVWFVAGATAEPEPEPVAEAPQADAPPTRTQADPVPEPADPGPAPVTPRRPPLSPEVTRILREEAERERARREAERSARQVTPQAELGLDAAPDPAQEDRADQARRRMAQLRSEPPPAPEPTVAVEPEPQPEPQPEIQPEPQPEAREAREAQSEPVAQRGRERLPDIEEINASLRAATERAPTHVGDTGRTGLRRRGFRVGFSSVLLIASLALVVYVAAPQVSRSLPATEPVLARYVDHVDELRLWLDLRVQGLLPVETAGEAASDAPDPAPSQPPVEADTTRAEPPSVTIPELAPPETDIADSPDPPAADTPGPISRDAPQAPEAGG